MQHCITEINAYAIFRLMDQNKDKFLRISRIFTRWYIEQKCDLGNAVFPFTTEFKFRDDENLSDLENT